MKKIALDDFGTDIQIYINGVAVDTEEYLTKGEWRHVAITYNKPTGVDDNE